MVPLMWFEKCCSTSRTSGHVALCCSTWTSTPCGHFYDCKRHMQCMDPRHRPQLTENTGSPLEAAARESRVPALSATRRVAPAVSTAEHYQSCSSSGAFLGNMARCNWRLLGTLVRCNCRLLGTLVRCNWRFLVTLVRCNWRFLDTLASCRWLFLRILARCGRCRALRAGCRISSSPLHHVQSVNSISKCCSLNSGLVRTQESPARTGVWLGRLVRRGEIEQRLGSQGVLCYRSATQTTRTAM